MGRGWVLVPRQHLKRRKDGRFACRYQGKWFYGLTEGEAFAARDAYKQMLKQGIQRNADSMDVRHYAASWLPIHKADVSKKHYNDCAHHIDILCDQIGGMLIKDVKPSDIKAVYSAHYLGLSASTIKRAKCLFSALFETAIEDGYATVNPCRSKHAKPPKGSSGSHRTITDSERALIHECSHSFRAAVYVMLYAGLRRGEALALNIDEDVDFEHHVIHVHHAIHYESNQPILGDPKTEAGEREIPLLSILENELRGLHGLLAPACKNGGLMSESAFSSAWNSYLGTIERKLNGHPKRWHHRGAKNRNHDPIQLRVEALIKAGKTEEAEVLRLSDWKTFSVRPHDFRHSYCTMLRDAGTDLKLAMKWMGHADEKMILKIYDHVTDFRTEQALSTLEKMTSGSQNGSQTENRIRNFQQYQEKLS